MAQLPVVFHKILMLQQEFSIVKIVDGHHTIHQILTSRLINHSLILMQVSLHTSKQNCLQKLWL